MSEPNPDLPVLHPIEKAILKSSGDDKIETIESLVAKTGLGVDQVRRGIEWLRLKNLILVQNQVIVSYSLGDAGKVAAERGLPERRLANAIKSGLQTVTEILASNLLKNDEVNASVASARRMGWVQIEEGGKLRYLDTANNNSLEELAISALNQHGSVEAPKLSQLEREGVDLLKKRPAYIKTSETKHATITLTELGKHIKSSLQSTVEEGTVRRLTPGLITSGKWKEARLSPIDVNAAAAKIYPGRLHPLTKIIDEIKEIFVGLGFVEIEGEYVQSAFWNFDALFTPQDHPAREMQDTFYLSSTKMSIPASPTQISRISAVHENGWGSEWSEAQAQRVVLRTHTTPVTLQFLTREKTDSGRYFSIGRVFRNEKPSYKHLVEFHQVEGVATYRGASLRDLVGLQTEFYKKMGIRKIKFWPTFFPYTEPSLQSMVYNESLGKWVELFGMGIFRPEVTSPLGIKEPVLAWGGGLERIAMLRFGLNDVRDLYSGRLSWLRSVPECPL